MTPYEKPRLLEPTMTKLLPCPFCGGEPAFQSFNATTLQGRIICSCGAEMRQGRNDSKETAIAAWNRRAGECASE